MSLQERPANDRTTPGHGYTKSLELPDESQTFPNGSSVTVRLGHLEIVRVVCKPGWHWAEQIKPIAGTDSCEFHHVGLGMSGELRFRMDHGDEFSVKGGDVFDVPPGHDVWVIGDEPSVTVMWRGWRGFGKSAVQDRVVTTLLFTDIVGSTQRAASMGDAAWDRLLDRHHAIVREVLDEYHGTEITTTGDGFLATFPGAARALTASLAIEEAVSCLQLEIRAAVHTGEVEIVPDNIRGIAIHEASRMLSLAKPGEILVSNTTRELASGPGLIFVDRGTHSLAGLPGKRKLYLLASTSRNTS